MKQIKIFILILVTAGIIVGILMTPLFNTAKVLVIGNKKITEEQVLSYANITIGQNMFRTSTLKIKNTIKKDPYTKDVYVRRKLPSTIEIEVVERKPVLQISFINGYVYLDSQGYILEISAQKSDAILLEGLSTSSDSYVAGNRLIEEDLLKLEKVFKVLEAARNNDLYELVVAVNMKDEANFILTMEEGKKKVELGDLSDLTTKFLYLKQILSKEQDKEGTIYLNQSINASNPKFVERT